MPRPGQNVSTRDWYIDVHSPKDGRFVFQPDSDGELDALLADVGVLLSRVGGTFSIVADRARVGDGEADFITLGYKARWEAFSPAVDLRSQEPPPEQPPVDEPPAAGEPLSDDELEQHFPDDELDEPADDADELAQADAEAAATEG